LLCGKWSAVLFGLHSLVVLVSAYASYFITGKANAVVVRIQVGSSIFYPAVQDILPTFIEVVFALKNLNLNLGKYQRIWIRKYTKAVAKGND